MVSRAFTSSGNAMIFTEVSIYRCSSEYRIYQHINIVRLIKGFEYVLYLSSYIILSTYNALSQQSKSQDARNK